MSRPLASLRFLLGLLSLTWVSCQVLQSVEVVERYPAGNPLREHVYRPWGPRDSLHRIGVRTYFFNGHRDFEATYRKGQRHGPFREYWHNGQIKSEGHYQRGLREGRWSFYWNRFQLSSQGEYRHDRKNGPWTEYYENGELRRRGAYADGREIGAWEGFDGRGEPLWVSSCFAANDTGSYRSFHGDASPDEAYACLQGRPVGPYVRRDAGGVTVLEGAYDSAGRRMGLWLGRHPDGILASRCSYREDLWQDSVIEYDSLGRLAKRGRFDAGTGQLETLDPAGRRLELATYRQGRREGETLAYDSLGRLRGRFHYAGDTLRALERYHPDGRLAQTGRYVGGKRDSLWVRYHENGAKAETAWYREGVLEGEQAFYDRSGQITQTLRYEHGYPAEGRFRGVPGVTKRPMPPVTGKMRMAD